MKVISYGFVFLLFFSTSALIAEEIGQVEAPSKAKEPLQVIVAGVTGDELKNVQLALSVPAGLVHEGKVDRLWLERFRNQIPEKVRQALEPFGYYDVQTKVSLETVEEGIYKLHVEVEPGKPVLVASVKVSIRGQGADEKVLKELLKAFPLKKGDVLLHKRYEEAKGNLKTEALNLGYLDADYSVHTIRVSRTKHGAEIELTLQTGPREQE